MLLHKKTSCNIFRIYSPIFNQLRIENSISDKNMWFVGLQDGGKPKTLCFWIMRWCYGDKMGIILINK